MTALVPQPRAPDASAAALVDAAMDGDERAWQELCEQHVAAVRAVAHARLGDHHAAEDVVQETMLRAWTRLPQLADVTRFGAWLKTIAANVAVDHVRRQRATAPLAAARDRPAALPSHDEVVVAGEEAAPGVALLARWRTRWAGLGEAVPLVIAAPAVVVVVVAGVVTPPEPTAPPPTSVAPTTPTPTPFATTDPTPTATTPGAAPAPTTAPSTAPPTAVPSAPPSADPSTGAGVDVLGGSVRFRDEPPTDDDEDASTPGAPTGPIAGIELSLEDLGLGDVGLGDVGLGDVGLGDLAESCLLCG